VKAKTSRKGFITKVVSFSPETLPQFQLKSRFNLSAREKALNLHCTIQSHLSDHRRGEVIRSGIRLAIFGPPNAGKSSLLNFLGMSTPSQFASFLLMTISTAKREAAIVTHVPGTTRDILELSLDIGGMPLIVADTAGLRSTDDLVEKIGIDRAKDTSVDNLSSLKPLLTRYSIRISNADVSLCVLALPDVTTNASNRNHVQLPPSMQPFVSSETFFLLNKSDLVVPRFTTDLGLGPRAWIASLHTGDGMMEFLAGFTKALQER